MERHSNPIDPPPRPPALAEWVFRFVAHQRVRETLLGDLAEEFAFRSNASSSSARTWYWRELGRSLPHLIIARARSSRKLRWLLNGLTVCLVVMFLLAWDLFVSRPSAYWLATQEQPPALILIRICYFTAQAFGALIGGMFVALIAFNTDRPFWRNATLYLGPIILVLIALSSLAALERGLVESSSYLLLRNGLAMLALLSSAAMTSRLVRR